MDFTRLSVVQLKEAFRRLDLEVSGNKAELIRRLQEAPALAATEDEAGLDTEEAAGMDDEGNRGKLEVQVREPQGVAEVLAAQLKALRPLASRAPQEDMSVHATCADNNAHLSTPTLQPSLPDFPAVATSISQKILLPCSAVASLTVT